MKSPAREEPALAGDGSQFGSIGRRLALRAWGVGVYSLPIQICFFTMAYLTLRTGGSVGIVRLLMLSLALWAYLGYGVLVNDHFDRDIDIASGKRSAKRGHGLPQSAVLVILALLVVLSAALVALIDGGPVFELLWGIAFVLATAYSAPPLRLRARGLSGFITDSLIEKPLPLAIVFSLFGYYGPEAVLFPVLGELLDSVLKHQLEDFDIDVAQKVRTFAGELGKARTSSVVSRLLHPLDALAVLAFLAAALLALPGERLVIGAAGLLFVVWFLAFLRLRSAGRVRTGFPFKDPPLVGYLTFALRTLVLGALALSVVLAYPGYLAFGLVVFASILVYAKGIAPLFSDYYRYLRGRGATVAAARPTGATTA